MPEHASLKRPSAKRAAPSETRASGAQAREVALDKPAPGPTFDIRTLAVHPPRTEPRPVQRVALPNRTGLPDRLKSGIEALSGLPMDDVRVHRNSAEPAKLGALAYARGGTIHLGPGQERHLPHEAWHLVQQKQGRVRATGRLNSTVHLNDEHRLEAEADAMGARAAAGQIAVSNPSPAFRASVGPEGLAPNPGAPAQLMPPTPGPEGDEEEEQKSQTNSSSGSGAHEAEAAAAPPTPALAQAGGEAAQPALAAAAPPAVGSRPEQASIDSAGLGHATDPPSSFPAAAREDESQMAAAAMPSNPAPTAAAPSPATLSSSLSSSSLPASAPAHTNRPLGPQKMMKAYGRPSPGSPTPTAKYGSSNKDWPTLGFAPVGEVEANAEAKRVVAGDRASRGRVMNSDGNIERQYAVTQSGNNLIIPFKQHNLTYTAGGEVDPLHGLPALFGGAVDYGESRLKAQARELKEESGNRYKLTHFGPPLDRKAVGKNQMTVHHARITETNDQVTDPMEMGGALTVDPSHFRDLEPSAIGDRLLAQFRDNRVAAGAREHAHYLNDVLEARTPAHGKTKADWHKQFTIQTLVKHIHEAAAPVNAQPAAAAAPAPAPAAAAAPAAAPATAASAAAPIPTAASSPGSGESPGSSSGMRGPARKPRERLKGPLLPP